MPQMQSSGDRADSKTELIFRQLVIVVTLISFTERTLSPWRFLSASTTRYEMNVSVDVSDAVTLEWICSKLPALFLVERWVMEARSDPSHSRWCFAPDTTFSSLISFPVDGDCWKREY